MMPNKQFNLSWGESVAVRSAFLETWSTPIVFDYQSMENLGYPAFEGNPELITLTKEVIRRQIGRDYPYVLMTNGATGGVTIALRSLADKFRSCIVRPPPHFRLYPSMIKAAGMKCVYKNDTNSNGVYLVDSLSNPCGEFSSMERNYLRNPIIWDAAYYGNIYAPGIHPKPMHDVLVGSYSKLTGLNGLRVGWIATCDPTGYQMMKELVTAEYCGISQASAKIIMDTVGNFSPTHWDLFEQNAQYKLDYNRGEFEKLEKFFGGTPVNPYGMFYYTPIDEACKRLLTKSGIIWSSGADMGTDDSFARFNVGQDVHVIRNAVASVLKNDRR